MRVRLLLFVLLSSFFTACSSGPDLSGIPHEKRDIVILGGSTYGLTVASALKEYDGDIDVVLIEEREEFVTEPYVNLYLAGEMDENLVYHDLAAIAKRRGYTLISTPVQYVDRQNRQIVFADRVIDCKRLIDARYRIEEIEGEYTLVPVRSSLDDLKNKLSKKQTVSVVVDGSRLPKEDRSRSLELYELLKSRTPAEGSRKVTLLKNGEEIPEKTDMVIRYPEYEKGATLRFSDNFFTQYNLGLEEVAAVVREDYNGSFLPNMVKEERFIFHNGENLKGLDPETNRTQEGTHYLSKVMKIQKDII